MTKSTGRRPTLVAERRHRSEKAQRISPQNPKKTPKKKPVRQKPNPKAPRGLLGWIMYGLKRSFGFVFRCVWGVAWRLGAVVSILIACGVFYFAAQMPELEEVIDGRARGSVTLSDRYGEVFAWRGDQFGGMIQPHTVSPHIVNAVVASEDKRFYQHFGVSPRGIASAVRINLKAGRGPLSGNGGSTITQQSAKLICLGVRFDPQLWKSERDYESSCRRSTLWRKIKEAVFSMAMEVAYTKDEILTIYLNRAYLGGGSRGFEAASQRYFGKSAKHVSAAEAAMLSGLLPAPSSYAPTRNLKAAQGRADTVLILMNRQGYLSDSEAARARAQPAGLSEAAERRAGGYFADWVMRSGPEFFTKDTTEDVRIQTTLDPKVQSSAEEALAWVFENKVKAGSEAEAAVVVMSADGAVRGMVGGRNPKVSGAFNRATQAKRQTGSAFKPFVFAAALELDFAPSDLILDEATCWTVPGSGEYCPKNYDRQFKGPVSLTQALMESRNIPAVVLSEDVGRSVVRSVANGFGITSDLAIGPALALGVSESTLLEMTGAYAGILNGGSSVTPYGLVSLGLLGDDTPLMTQVGGIGERVIREHVSRRLAWMMTQVVENGTGARAQLDGWQIAGKTGTTQAARDAWFIGFTDNYVTGVWMGYDDNRPLSGVTGGGLPADIWRETMARVLQGQEPSALSLLAGGAAEFEGERNAPSQVITPEVDTQGSNTIETTLESILDGIF